MYNREYIWLKWIHAGFAYGLWKLKDLNQSMRKGYFQTGWSQYKI